MTLLVVAEFQLQEHKPSVLRLLSQTPPTGQSRSAERARGCPKHWWRIPKLSFTKPDVVDQHVHFRSLRKEGRIIDKLSLQCLNVLQLLCFFTMLLPIPRVSSWMHTVTGRRLVSKGLCQHVRVHIIQPVTYKGRSSWEKEGTLWTASDC